MGTGIVLYWGVQNHGKHADIILECFLTEGEGCLNLLITSFTARLTMPTELIGERGGVCSAEQCPNCSCDLYLPKNTISIFYWL